MFVAKVWRSSTPGFRRVLLVFIQRLVPKGQHQRMVLMMPICLQNTSSILKAYLLNSAGKNIPCGCRPKDRSFFPSPLWYGSHKWKRLDWTSFATEVKHYQSPAGASCPRRDDLVPRASRRGPVRDRRKPSDRPYRPPALGNTRPTKSYTRVKCETHIRLPKDSKAQGHALSRRGVHEMPHRP